MAQDAGHMALRQSKYDKAATFYQQALSHYQKINDLDGESIALNSLGYLYSESQQYEKHSLSVKLTDLRAVCLVRAIFNEVVPVD